MGLGAVRETRLSQTAGGWGRRGCLGAVERAWSGAAGTVAWTRVLAPASALYAAASSRARAGAAATRSALPGVYVIAVGNLTVGGVGKSSLARWLALEVIAQGARPAVILRGHGARRRKLDVEVVPDYTGYPLSFAAERAGDEAAAHRVALPRRATVVVHRDRHRAARVAREGYGAAVAILDDGWEQRRLRWDELWVALDPELPEGNGALLPAGPLRRPTSTLSEASVILFLLEGKEEDVPRETLAWTAARAPHTPVLRLRRHLDGTSRVGEMEVEPWRTGTQPAGLVSGIGSPPRLERFAREAGIEIVSHAAFPDHARWSASAVRVALRRAARAGARVALITEKDEPRWPSMADPPLPTRVLRTSLCAIDPVDLALARLRAAVASMRPIE